ncbi:MAG TPA: hypothetical protein VI199_10155, partial [Novosphingobium sp.]
MPADADAALGLADDTRDFGMALLKLAAHMGEVVAGQINRVPHKNFLAFLDFLGMDRTPPKPARAPLTFTLTEKAPADRLVPKGTQVGAAKRDDVVFETDRDLLVTRATLSGAFSVDLRDDRYIDLGRLITAPGTEALEVFGHAGASALWLPHTHALYLGHDTLFSSAELAGADVTVTFHWSAGANPALDWAFSTAEGWKPVAAARVAGAGDNPVYAIRTAGIAPMTLTGHDDSGAPVHRSGCWLRAKAGEAAAMTISTIDIGTRVVDKPVPASLAYFNTSPLDTSKDFFPFGERPKFNDTFYIASRQAFGSPAATVKLSVTLTNNVSAPVHPVTLSWEYWDGSAWDVIGTANQDGTPSPDAGFVFSDTTKAFTCSGIVQFK